MSRTSEVLATERTTPSRRPVIGGVLAILGGTLMGLGTLLPWVSVDLYGLTLSWNGYRLGSFGSPWLTLAASLFVLLGVLAVVAGATTVMNRLTGGLSSWRTITIGLLGTGPFALGWSKLHSVAEFHAITASPGRSPGNGTLGISVGYGFWVCTSGVVLTLISGLVLRSVARHTAATPPRP